MTRAKHRATRSHAQTLTQPGTRTRTARVEKELGQENEVPRGRQTVRSTRVLASPTRLEMRVLLGCLPAPREDRDEAQDGKSQSVARPRSQSVPEGGTRDLLAASGDLLSQACLGSPAGQAKGPGRGNCGGAAPALTWGASNPGG